MSKRKALLVTGAAGFIGSHLAEKLVQNGRMVIGYDIFNDYYDPAQKERNLSELQRNDSFHIVRGDIRDAEKLKKAFNDWEIGVVVHLAAMVGVRNSLKYPELYTSINVGGTNTVLDVACKKGVEKFVFASSSSVYGNRKTRLFKESDHASTPSSVYAATKKAGEVLSYSYHSLYSIPIACLRFFTVYGPRGRPDQAPLKFIHRISNDIAIQQYGDGNSSRDYTYVTDIINGIIGAINASYEYEIFNLGNSVPITLTDFIKTIQDLTGKSAIIEKLPEQPGDVLHTLADIEKSKRMLNYEPQVNLKDGLKRMVEWYNTAKPIM